MRSAVSGTLAEGRPQLRSSAARPNPVESHLFGLGKDRCIPSDLARYPLASTGGLGRHSDRLEPELA